MTPEEHEARAAELLALADETFAAATSDLDDRHLEHQQFLETLAEVGVMAQLAQGHALLAVSGRKRLDSAA